MNGTVNRLTLIGNVGKNPETRSNNGNVTIARFSIATKERIPQRDGEPKEHTEWHDVTCFGKLAEIVGEYVRKGRKVFVEGTLRTESWSDKESGEKRSKLRIIASSIQLLDAKKPEAAPQPAGVAANDEEAPF